MSNKLGLVKGKWVYIWMISQIFNGDIARIIAELKTAGVVGIALKVHNGYYKWDDPKWKIDEFVQACAANGIRVVFWGYSYLKYNPTAEADAAADMVLRHKDICLAYLIDVEAEAKNHPAEAKTFGARLKSRLGGIVPLGLNSYRFPVLHPELPWKELRAISDFDCPQVYYRWSDPVSQLARSKREFAAMNPKLPFLPAGDMYFEGGYKPTGAQLRAFLEACKSDPDIPAAIMWSMDQIQNVPELWRVFSEFSWPVGDQPPNPNPSPVDIRVPLANFFDACRLELATSIDYYQSLYDLHAHGSALPDVPANPPEAAAIVIGIRSVLAIPPVVIPDPGSVPPVSTGALWAGIVTASALYKHSSPDNSAESRIGHLVNGERVAVYERLGDWLRIGPGVWVSAKWIQRISL